MLRSVAQCDGLSGAAADDKASEAHRPDFNHTRHVQYHRRCLKTLLPTHYTSTDSHRMLLAFFTLTALDLLGELDSCLSEAQRTGHIDWLYTCQFPNGGFRGFPGTKIDDDLEDAPGAYWDLANIAGTYFALEMLVILGDDWSRVNRRATLRWLSSLQRADGSFGELVGPDGRPSGDPDLRYCHMAAAVWYMLGGKSFSEPVINIDNLARFVLASQSFDGGLGRAPLQESHSGETYCGIGCLSLIDRLPTSWLSEKNPNVDNTLTHWLVSRQTEPIANEYSSESEDEHDEEITTESQHVWAGFNGRCNKPPDTCYSFWTVASLAMVGRAELINAEANRRYLLDKTQHQIGGFSKVKGDPPDIMHAALGLAALSLIGEPGVKPLDPVLCISLEAKKRVDDLRSGLRSI